MLTNILIHPKFHLPSKGELLNKPTQMQTVIAVVSQQPMERAKKQWPDRSSQKKADIVLSAKPSALVPLRYWGA